MFIKTKGTMYMNNQEKDILNKLFMEPYVNQRVLSEMTGHSLGIVNRSISQLLKEGFINCLLYTSYNRIFTMDNSFCVRCDSDYRRFLDK